MRRSRSGILAIAMLASACAYPTELPNWDMTWNLPVPDKGKLSIAVGTFLPTGVDTVSGSTTAFHVTVANPPAISRTLGADCTSCTAVNGTNAPKPAFSSAPPATSVNFAAATSLTSATLAPSSKIVFSINNGFNFDPIRPQAGSATTNTGTITLTVSNGSVTLGTLTILGTASAIPAGQITNFTVPLTGTITGTQPLSVTMTMNSPAGSNVLINTSQVFSVTATPTVDIASATVSVAARPINTAPAAIDLSDIDSTIVERIVDDDQVRGTMFLTITNPFTLGGSPTITFRSSATTPPAIAITPITKAFTLTAASNVSTPNTSTVAINFTGKELRKILGQDLEVIFGGTTSAGSLTVTPSQKITTTLRMQLNFNIKEQP